MTHTEYRSIRAALGLTQAEIAKELGVSRETINRRESGEQPITKEAGMSLHLLSQIQMETVITYSSPSGDKIHLTPGQADRLRTQGKWPKTVLGEEYCQVSHGRHAGRRSFSDEEIEERLR